MNDAMIVTSTLHLRDLPVGTILVDRSGSPVWRNIFGWCSGNGSQNIDLDLIVGDGAPLTILYIPGRAPLGMAPDPDAEKLEVIATAAAKADGLKIAGRMFADSPVYGRQAQEILTAIRKRWDLVDRVVE